MGKRELHTVGRSAFCVGKVRASYGGKSKASYDRKIPSNVWRKKDSDLC